jgi:chromosome segregation ATPase
LDAAVIGAWISTGGALLGAGYAGRASLRANRIQREAVEKDEVRRIETEARKFEADTFARAKAYYDDVIERLSMDLARVNADMARVNLYVERLRNQLEREQNVSDELRGRLRDLEDRIQDMKTPIQSMQQPIEELRRQDTPPPYVTFTRNKPPTDENGTTL